MYDTAQKQRLVELISDYGIVTPEVLAEHLISQGVIALPCNIGDTVYIIGGKYRHGSFEKWINTGKFRLSDLKKIGKAVFLTREEAEKVLGEVKKSGN